MKRTIFVLAMSLFLPATINAADIDGKYAVSVANGKMGSCGQYITARDEGRRSKYRKENRHIGWIFGYLTAYISPLYITTLLSLFLQGTV